MVVISGSRGQIHDQYHSNLRSGLNGLTPRQAEDVQRPLSSNRRAWDIAAQKYVDENDELLATGPAHSLRECEVDVLGELLARKPRVVHLQSGNGLDDLALTRLGATSVVGVDFSAVTTVAAASRAREVDLRVSYAVADVAACPIRSGSAGLVYTGQGALCWLPDLDAWASEATRLLEPGGHLFVFDEHPMAPLWTLSAESVGVRDDRSYFGDQRTNDTFPASAIARFAHDSDIEAIEWQHSLASVLNAVIRSGLNLVHLAEYPEPFWRPAGVEAAAWDGRLPNSFALLAQRPS